jgi:hypothetical protein
MRVSDVCTLPPGAMSSLRLSIFSSVAASAWAPGQRGPAHQRVLQIYLADISHAPAPLLRAPGAREQHATIKGIDIACRSHKQLSQRHTSSSVASTSISFARASASDDRRPPASAA